MPESYPSLTQTGRYSPLRYPGGKGKLARFMKEVVRLNGLSDGRYVEPYAGGAAVAWELLLTGIVRRVAINDISVPVFAFWDSVLNSTDDLCRMIHNCPLSIEEWDKQKEIFKKIDQVDYLSLGFSFFFLNRTNRSGILNGGVIGGRKQTGTWKIDARFNRSDLIARIEKIASLRSRIELTNLDAVQFIKNNSDRFSRKTLLYIDPPYFEKGRFLYHDAYRSEDHAIVAESVTELENLNWIVSYDDVRPIHDLYAHSPWLQYTLNYSARNATRGREVMFFSQNLQVPEVSAPLMEVDRDVLGRRRPIIETKCLVNSF
ncbi:DNA adenine methylase [Acetobacter senegalensis]|uniref:DNA adenine methylase n=1 Tax=Acetobacter senegalensis TaxID=446692 RepID=UPI002655AF87|nr:DNA adenine methylase [Acetobacter senegalensis]MDN7353321.1 DNA adenine methylase [Acetobacter senegalensis]